MKRLVLAAASAAVLALACAPAQAANYETEADLLEHCSNDDMTCMLYVSGAYDQLSAMNEWYHAKGERGFYCTRVNLTHASVKELTETYMREHPEAGNNLAAGAVTVALMQAFPCS
jgi:hypothetical protein